MKRNIALLLIMISTVVLNGASPVESTGDVEKNHELKTEKDLALSGSVVDQVTGEKLICAKIEIEEADLTIFTDIQGDFSISGFQPGDYNLKVSYISYEEKVIKSRFDEQTQQMTITLLPL
jgi:hypothetical protein